MDISDLQTAVSELGKVLELCEQRIRPRKAPVIRVLCELYAIKVASKVLTGLGRLDGLEFETNRVHDEAEDRFGAQIELPSYAAFQSVAQQLRVALESNERAGVVAALQEIGVFALCPDTDRQFARLEKRIGSVIGRAQLIPLVELSIFALELGQIERSGKYATEAHALGPGASEQHDLCTVEGVIALHTGNIAEAKGA